MNSKDTKGIVYIILQIWVLMVMYFYYMLPQNQSGYIFGVSFNYFAYLTVVLSAFAVYLIVLRITNMTDKKCETGRFFYIYCIVAILTLICLYYIYDKETESSYWAEDWHLGFLRENAPHPLFAICMIAGILICGIVIKKRVKIGILIKHVFALILSILGGSFAYAPNPYKNEIWGVYHTHAYTNSIVHVANLEPYDDVMKSIYGHYAMIYFPFVRLLGDNYMAIAITIALFTAIMYFCAFYVLIHIIRDDLLSIVSMIAVLGTSVNFFGKGEYFQIMPHRCLFPMLVLAFCVWHTRHRDIKYVFKIGNIMLGIFSILFNLETGLVCVVVLCIASFFDKSRKGLGSWIKDIVIEVIFCIICFAGAYLLVNAYNMRLDGEWNSIKTFIFPIGSEGYDMQDILRLPLPKPLTEYMLHMIVFLASAFSSFVRLIKYKHEEDNASYIRLIISVSGIGLLTYFINRTVGICLSISHIQLIMLLALYSDLFIQANVSKEEMKKDAEKTFRYLLSMIAFALVIWFSLESFMATGMIMENHKETVWETDSLKEDLENFEKWKREGVPAMGIGVPEFYYYGGEEVNLVLTDWGLTIDHPGFKKVGYFLENETEEVIVGDVYAIEWALEDYEVVDTFEGNNIHMKYYHKKQQ